MNLSSGSMKKAVMNVLCEDRKAHESRKLRLMGLLVLSDDIGCMYQPGRGRMHKYERYDNA